jgi:hypothetical protein
MKWNSVGMELTIYDFSTYGPPLILMGPLKKPSTDSQ